MTEEGLSGLALLSIERQFATELDYGQNNGLLCENEAQTKDAFVELYKYKYNIDTS